MTTQENNSAVEAEFTEEVTEEVAQISLNDLATVINIIDVVSKRGVFEGGELESVGIVRNRLAAFVKASMPPEPEVDEESDSTEPEAS